MVICYHLFVVTATLNSTCFFLIVLFGKRIFWLEMKFKPKGLANSIVKIMEIDLHVLKLSVAWPCFYQLAISTVIRIWLLPASDYCRALFRCLNCAQ